MLCSAAGRWYCRQHLHGPPPPGFVGFAALPHRHNWMSIQTIWSSCPTNSPLDTGRTHRPSHRPHIRSTCVRHLSRRPFGFGFSSYCLCHKSCSSSPTETNHPTHNLRGRLVGLDMPLFPYHHQYSLHHHSEPRPSFPGFGSAVLYHRMMYSFHKPTTLTIGIGLGSPLDHSWWCRC